MGIQISKGGRRGEAMSRPPGLSISNDFVNKILKDKAEVMLSPQDLASQRGEFGIKDPNGYALILGADISKK